MAGTGRHQHQDLHPTGAVIARASTDFRVFRLRVGQTATGRGLEQHPRPDMKEMLQ